LVTRIRALQAIHLDRKSTVRETLEHVLYWERDSIDTLKAEFEQTEQKES
jgi:hypothetical protein